MQSIEQLRALHADLHKRVTLVEQQGIFFGETALRRHLRRSIDTLFNTYLLARRHPPRYPGLDWDERLYRELITNLNRIIEGYEMASGEPLLALPGQGKYVEAL